MVVQTRDWRETLSARKISNSETSAWLACQRKWYYAHSMNIKPRSYGMALNRGIIGHEALAAYYDALLAGNSADVASKAADSILAKYYLQATESTEKDMLRKLMNLCYRYFEVDPVLANGWEIIAVEKQYDLKLTDDFDYSLRLDLLVNDPATGENLLVDHKFVYDFWQQYAFDLNPQIPKYIAALRNNGIRVDKAVVNMFRHRVDPMKSDNDALFKMVSVKPSVVEMRRVMREHIKVSEQIVQMRSLPLEEQSNEVMRNMSQVTCKNCSFTDLCKSELMGGDITLMVETYYTQNNYGYNSEDDA